MELLDRNQLEFFSTRQNRFCVSLFLPTHRAGVEIRQDPIRLKNMAKEAESRLMALGMRPVKARELLAPVQSLVRRGGFWRNQADGLAVFVSGGFFQYFRLPLNFPELVAVMDRYEVSPLTPLFTAGGRFYLLAISKNQAKLFEGTRYLLGEVQVPRMPANMDEALKFDVRESQLQVHSGAGGSRVGKEGAVFTGQGIGVDDEQPRTLEYILQVERAVRRRLNGHQAPLLLAGVKELVAMYRQVNKYGQLLDAIVAGNPELLRPDELHAAAWQAISPFFHEDRKRALATYQGLKGSGKYSSDLREILFAAYQGRIQSVFLPSGSQKWGHYKFEDNALDVHNEFQPGDQELLNLAAVETILRKGTVYMLRPEEMPDGAEVAATLRFSIAPTEAPRAASATAS
jgi:hypothetical protein